MRFRANRSEAAKNLQRVEEQLVAACAALKCPPDALMGETQSRLDAMCEAAAVELGKPMSRDESRLQAAYDLALREITKRLKAERKSPQGKDKRSDDADDGEGIRHHVPPVAGTDAASPPSGQVAEEKPEDVVVVVHGEHDTKSDDGGQA